MRNLYSRLGLDSAASADEIKAAITQSGDEKLIQDATVVLLDANRRGAYDIAHHALLDIGSIRGALEMGPSDHWSGPLIDDYSNPGVARESLYAKLARKLGTPEDEKPRHATFSDVFGSLFASVCYVAAYGCAVVVLAMTMDQFVTEHAEADTEQYIGATVPLPYNGESRQYSGGQAAAPFQVSATDKNHYFVEIIDLRSDKLVLDVFVRQGYTAHVQVPLGTYRVRYVSGTRWYGDDDHFGFDSRYKESEIPIVFGVEGYRVVGHSIVLPTSDGAKPGVPAIDVTENMALDSAD